MNLTGKLDLDGLLRAWPAPSSSDDLDWDERAQRTLQTAQARPPASEAVLAAVLAAPPLAPEPGEPGAEPARSDGRHSGEAKMSQGSDRDELDRPSVEPRSSIASTPPGKKRMSLKEIAERASQSGMAGPNSRNSTIPTPVPSRPSAISTPIPPALATPIPSRPGSMPPARPGEAKGEDSGLINLKAVTEPPKPEPVAAAAAPEGAQPLTTETNFGDDSVPASAEARTQRRPATLPQAAAKKKGSGGVVAGVSIAVVGLAAAFAIMMTRKPATEQPQATAPVATEQKQPEAQAPAQQPAAPVAAAAEQQPSGTDPSALPDAKPGDDGKVAQAPAGGGAAAPAATAPAGQAGQAVAQATPEGQQPKTPGAPAKPGDLNSAMQQAVGSDGAQGASETPEPAAGKPLTQSVPEQPPQGAAAAAIRSVMPGAKACVAGADDVTRAQVTFTSSGTVSNVSVSGWAASNGQSSCVKSALQGANVGPFSKPTFMMPVTIRP